MDISLSALSANHHAVRTQNPLVHCLTNSVVQEITANVLLPRVLSIAGTDPIGGAGLQADLKSISAAGGYGMGVVTSLVVQNTAGVQQVQTPSPEFLTAQLEAVSSDVPIDAIKIGMLADEPSTLAVISWLDSLPASVPVVVDPVMVASSGHSLADSVSLDLLKRASLITPNLDELAQLTDSAPASCRADLIEQAQKLCELTGALVLAKGGHLDEADRGNSLVSADGVLVHVPSAYVQTTASHGTGCSLSSALATRLGAGEEVEDAVAWATAWLREALAAGEALEVSTSNGPIDHFHRLRRQASFALQTPRQISKQNSFTPLVAPAGPFTQKLWDSAGASLERFISEGFIPALVEGSLSQEQFRFYIQQDDYYLGVYGSVLALLAARASNSEQRQMWLSSASNAIEVEQEMHRVWSLGETSEPSPVTLAYTDFLRAESNSDYVVAVAAVLPCFWLYSQLGDFVPDAVAEDHPYKLWLDTYDDPDFQQATAKVVELMEELLEDASESQRQAAQRSFWRACVLEGDFFAQAMLIDRL